MKLNVWPFNRRKHVETHIQNASLQATAEHKKVIKSLQDARGDAEKLKKVIEKNGFTIQIAKAMTGGHK